MIKFINKVILFTVHLVAAMLDMGPIIVIIKFFLNVSLISSLVVYYMKSDKKSG
jgi:hypothetical protein